jgi:hypothetical protein
MLLFLLCSKWNVVLKSAAAAPEKAFPRWYYNRINLFVRRVAHVFFFIAGVNTKAKDIGNVPNSICPSCGAYANMYVSVLFEALSLFFVPVFKWNRRYLVTLPCCGAVYELDQEEGRAFERGEINTINPGRMHKVSGCSARPGVCPQCGAALPPGARFCSQCGAPIR